MTVDELLKVSKKPLSEIAKILGITTSAAYHWKKDNEVPPLRIYELKALRPQWFEEKV